MHRFSAGDRTLDGSAKRLPGSSDAVDVALAGAGDQAAFERLYRRHVPRIYSLAMRMVGPEEAEETTQEIFVRAWRKLDSFKGEAAFGTWLYRVGVNVSLTRRTKLGKQRERQQAGDEILESIAARSASVDYSVDFEAALQGLPDGAREVLVLHDVEGYKHQEIAETLGITAGTSKSQLHRARMMMRKLLRR